MAIRQHEYGHLALEGARIFSPKVLPRLCGDEYRIHEGWAQAGLDVIVNSFMLAAGAAEIVHLVPCELPFSQCLSRSEAAMLTLRSHLLSCEASLCPLLAATGNFDATDQSLLSNIAVELAAFGARQKRIPTRAIALRLRILQAIFGPHEQDPSSTDSLGSADTARDPVLKRQLASCARGSAPKWGEMSLLHRPLSQVHVPARRALRYRPAYAGAFRYPHRACLPAMDGRAFRGGVSGLGGTALVDCSGSMQLSMEGLRGILDALPAATVAMYAGFPSDTRRGWLSIVARRGRMIELESFAGYIGSYNVIDAHALTWLQGQKSPRLWISDGRVNGIGGKVSADMILEVMDLVRSGRIKRYGNVGSLLAAFRPQIN
jgi:hypothetical protein